MIFNKFDYYYSFKYQNINEINFCHHYDDVRLATINK